MNIMKNPIHMCEFHLETLRNSEPLASLAHIDWANADHPPASFKSCNGDTSLDLSKCVTVPCRSRVHDMVKLCLGQNCHKNKMKSHIIIIIIRCVIWEKTSLCSYITILKIY